jgi:plastocyanin
MPGPVRWLLAGALAAPVAGVPAVAQQVAVSGTLLVRDKGDRQAEDVGQAVVWLEAAGLTAPAPDSAVVMTEGKEFRPRITVVAVGSTVSFPNNDPFNHNVFSLSPESSFDLGLYGRGRSRSADFPRAGLVRVYCNVHATMSAFVVAVPTPYHARPAADGTFRLEGVPAGRYTLKAWHERAAAVAERELIVSPRGVDPLRVELDARRFTPVAHLNKFGQPYRTAGRRY